MQRGISILILVLGAVGWNLLSLSGLAAQTLKGIVLDTKGKGVSGAVVWAEPLHKSFEVAPPSDPAVMEQRNLAFVPSVLPILVGTRVRFPNHDAVYHNIYSFSKANRFSLGLYPPGTAPSVVFDTPGVVKIFCNIHDFMRATILVLETPYFTVTDKQGTYTLSGLEPGSYQLRVWYADRYAPPQPVEVLPGKILSKELIIQTDEQ